MDKKERETIRDTEFKILWDRIVTECQDPDCITMEDLHNACKCSFLMGIVTQTDILKTQLGI